MEIKKEAAGFEVKVGEEVFAYDTLDEVIAKVHDVFPAAAAGNPQPVPAEPVDPTPAA